MGKEGLTPFCYATPPADLNLMHIELYTNLNKIMMKKRNTIYKKLLRWNNCSEYNNTLLTIRLAQCHSTEEMLVILQIYFLIV